MGRIIQAYSALGVLIHDAGAPGKEGLTVHRNRLPHSGRLFKAAHTVWR